MLYAQRGKPMNETAMCWGFDCGDGWYGIIRELSEQLEWLNEMGVCRVEATQVKEKFGTLRFYTALTEVRQDYPEGMVWALTGAAEAASSWVCEQCGAPGRPNGSGWIRTLCNKCAAKSSSGAPDVSDAERKEGEP